MATVQPQTPTLAGITPAYVAASAADIVPVQIGSKYLLHVKNTGGGACTVTVDDPNTPVPSGTLAGAFNPDVTMSVPITVGDKMMVLDTNRFRDVNGNLNIAFSVTAGVTYAVIGPLA